DVHGARLEGVPADGPGDDGGDGAGDGLARTRATAGGGEEEEAILPDVAAVAAQRDEYLDALQRLKADFDNYRKRVARLEVEQTVRAAADLVGKLLPVLDNLDLACAHLGGDRTSESAEGEEARAVEQARRQLLDVLAKEGLERVDAVDVDFDPTVHDAVAHAPAAEEDAGAGGAGVAVDEVMRAGYRWRGQVVRPAMVRVRG
ncbi:MAG: nucleotide exchange factor GrpE, partial [Acidimicrobiales bacterium]